MTVSPGDNLPGASPLVDLLGWFDDGLIVAGLLVVVAALTCWLGPRRHAGWRLRRRIRRLPPEALLLPLGIFLVAAAGLQPLVGWLVRANADAPATQPGGAAAEVVQGALVTNLAMAITAAVGYGVGTVAVGTRRRSFLRGGRSWSVLVVYGLGGTLAALALCPLTAAATNWLIARFHPGFGFPEHGVIQTLRDPACPPWAPIVLWLGVTVATPLAEEIFFRGLLQTAFLRLLRRRWLAVLLSAALFGTAHCGQPQVVPAMVVFGLIAGLIYERTGGLSAVVLVHALFNAKTMLWETVAGP